MLTAQGQCDKIAHQNNIGVAKMLKAQMSE
jgi:hypothetical protein